MHFSKHKMCPCLLYYIIAAHTTLRLVAKVTMKKNKNKKKTKRKDTNKKLIEGNCTLKTITK